MLARVVAPRRAGGARPALLVASIVLYGASAWMANRPVCAGCVVTEVRLNTGGRVVRGRLYAPPNGGRSLPAVVVSHGYLANLAFMEVPWAADLTALGAVAFILDRRGHGGTGGSLWPPTDGAAAPIGEQEPEVKAAIGHVRSLVGLVDPARIALLGHSDGATAALVAGSEDWRVRATAALSASVAPWHLVNHVAPRNLLLVYGEEDRFVIGDTDRMLIRRATRGHLDGVGTYGRFDDGSARRLASVHGRGHVDLLYSNVARRSVLEWLKRSLRFSGESALAPLRIGWLISGAVAIAVALASSGGTAPLDRVPNPGGGAYASVAGVSLAWIAALLLAPRLVPLLPWAPAQEGGVVLALLIASTTTPAVVAPSVACLACCIRLRLSLRKGRGGVETEAPGQGRTPPDSAFARMGTRAGAAEHLGQAARGALAGAAVIAALRILLLHYYDVPLGRERFLLFLLFAALALPPFALLHGWLGTVGKKAASAVEAALAALTAVSGGLLFERMAALPVYVFATTLVFAAAHRAGRVDRSPAASAVLGALLFGRAAAAVCALY